MKKIKNFIEWFQLILTLIIIMNLIVGYYLGHNASWIYIFIGWSFVLIYEIKILLNKYKLYLKFIEKNLKKN